MMATMRTTINLQEDALLVARQVAARDRISLGEAISRLVRQGATAQPQVPAPQAPLHGRFALLPQRDEVITPDHIRQLMEREGI